MNEQARSDRPDQFQPFRVGHAAADHWGLAAKSCLDQLGPIDAADNIGFLYVTETFANDIGSVLTFLRETTRIEQWVGGVGFGICATGTEYHEAGAIAAMTGRIPPDSFRVFSGLDLDAGWIAGHAPPLALIHGDPGNPSLPRLISHVAEATGGYLVGGITSHAQGARQIANEAVSGGVSGLLLGPEIGVSIGLSQGCTPIGPVHTVTEGVDGVLIEIDGHRALDLLKEESGDLIARNLSRAAGYIHVALPVAGSDTADYTVRNLVGIDPERGWIAVGAPLGIGDKLIFVRRDSNTAQEDLRRMVRQAGARALKNGPIRAGIYVSCVARGPNMFGPESGELATIREELGDLPLIGFYANGEICNDRLYGYTGVLTLIS
jgi:small ligand-binding sensory domain FIST